MSSGTLTTEGYLRVSSLAIALYDYLITLPMEYRVYRSQPGFLHMSLACILFILIRYISMTVMITSNYGFFATTFTKESCRRFFFLPPMFKVMQSMVSHAILGVRTFNIAGRGKHIGMFLLGCYVITIALEWFFDLYQRTWKTTNGNCLSGEVVANPTTWVFYLVAMIYDFAMLVISTIHLYRYRSYSGKFSQLIRVMIYDGLIFFVALTGVNTMNLVLYRQQKDLAAQSTASSLAYAVIWIMSQRILIHLRELSPDQKGSSPVAAVVVRPHGSMGGSTSHHQRMPQSPLRQHSSAFSSPLDRKPVLHDISETDGDLEFGHVPSSPIPLQHHHPFSTSGAIVNGGTAGDHFNRAVQPMAKDTGKNGHVQVLVERSVYVEYRY